MIVSWIGGWCKCKTLTYIGSGEYITDKNERIYDIISIREEEKWSFKKLFPFFGIREETP